MTAKRCAYLTMENTDGWAIDIDLAFPPMAALGWQIDAVAWRKENPAWDQYDAVYIGVPWDYPQDPEKFLALLGEIDRSRAILVNDLALVRWTLAKTYLRDLESKGAGIVPSLWPDAMTADVLDNAFESHGADRIVVKPVVNTGAADTYLLDRGQAVARMSELQEKFRGRPFIVQSFIENVLTDGEYSLFYFNNVLSHATVKVPKPGDFRVQEEYGADLKPIDPDRELRRTGDRVMSLVRPTPVYARADFVRGPDGRYLVMELELIEPSMYLRMDPQAPGRFAEAFNDYVEQKQGRTT
jgi:hypothetical protein